MPRVESNQRLFTSPLLTSTNGGVQPLKDQQTIGDNINSMSYLTSMLGNPNSFNFGSSMGGVSGVGGVGNPGGH